MPSTKQAMENKNLNIYLSKLDHLDKTLDMFLHEDQRQFIIVRAHRYGAPIYEYTGGTSSNEYGIRQDTISCVFSITKPVAAVLIMKLQEDGLIDISDSMSKYFDCFKGEGKESILIWHLLTHTSGIEEDKFYESQKKYIKTEYGLLFPENASREEYIEFGKQINKKMGLCEDSDFDDKNIKFLKSYKPTKNPGEFMSYCNFGYRLIGKLIEQVSGMSIDEYSRKVLFEPIGMSDSHFILPEEKWARTAGRNEKCSDYEYLNSKDCFENDKASGGLKSTVIDMCKFGDMILSKGTYNGKRIISSASVKEICKDHNYLLSKNNPWDSWGLGFNIRTTKKDDAGVLRSAISLEHGGAYGHKFLADPEYGVSISVFTGEYKASVFDSNHAKARNIFSAINNMIIAALD